MADIIFAYRAMLTKGEELRYLSHLDYAALMERAIARAKLPAAYSEGFNPHMKLNFASALAVGVTSDAEYMDFELTKEVAPAEVRRRLEKSLPPGVQVLALRMLYGRHTALMAAVDEASYEINVPLAGSLSEAEAAVRAFNSATECVITRVTPKKTREIEARVFVLGDIALRAAGDDLTMDFHIKITPTGSLKPSEVLTLLAEKFAMPINPDSALIKRTGLFVKGKQPMTRMGDAR